CTLHLNCCYSYIFPFNDASPTFIYTLSLHDALPIFLSSVSITVHALPTVTASIGSPNNVCQGDSVLLTSSYDATLSYQWQLNGTDRKSTRLNSSHLGISYAVFCLKKKKKSIYPDNIY